MRSLVATRHRLLHAVAVFITALTHGAPAAKGSGHCVARQPEQTDAMPSPLTTLGIVLVFCDEPMDFLHKWSCHDLTVYAYSKCGMSQHPALEHLQACVELFKVVPRELAADISGVKHHTQYLEWIIKRYGQWHTMNWFLKGTFPKCMNYKKPQHVNVTAALNEVKAARYAFKSFGHIKLAAVKSSSHFHWHWQSEICAVLSRYTCRDMCKARSKLKEEVFWNRGTTYAISGSRLGTLPLSEYTWLHEYVGSIAPGNRGIKRRFVMERAWQVALGCPQDALQEKIQSCPHGAVFPSGSTVSPPGLLIKHGAVQWTGVKADGGGFLSSIRGVFGKKKQKIKKPVKEDMETGIRHKGWYLQDPKLPITTFAVAVADIDLLRPLMTSEDGESVLELQLQRLFLMLARVHKSYKFVFILSSETNSSIVSEGYWSDGVAEVRRYNVLDHAMSALPHCNPGLPSLPDIAYSLIRAQLESMYLEDLAEEAAKKGPGSHTGNLVFLNLFSIVGGDISHAFLPEEKLYTAGIPVSSDGTTIPPMVTWYVFKDGIQQTSLLLKALQKNIRSEIIADCTTAADAAPAGKGMLYEHLLQQAMECLAAGWNTGAGVRHTCGEWAAAKPAEQEKLPIKMLPCQVFGADLASTKKGYKAHEAKHSCQYQYASSVVAQLAPKDRRFAPSALKRMFCMYTDYCDGSLKGTGYNLRHGDRSKVAFKG